MRSVIRLTIVMAMAATAMFVTAPAEAAGPFVCTGAVDNATITTSVIVPAGVSCEITNSSIAGSVTAGPGSSLLLGGLFPMEVSGSVTADHPKGINLFATVGGNVSFRGITGIRTPINVPVPVNSICGSKIGGAVTIADSGPAAPLSIGGGACGNPAVSAGSIAISGNAGVLQVHATSNANLLVNGNTGGGTLFNSDAGGSILCKNAPALATGANTAKGINQANGATC